MTPDALPLIAIDGPAASGKSSTARAVAKQLGLVHIDSGALYRTAAWIALDRGIEGPAEIAEAAAAANVALVREGVSLRLSVDGREAESVIRTPQVTRRVSEVASMPPVREWVDNRLREAVIEWGGAVMDGRDIGTVVFPDAALKVFLTASPEIRAVRRLKQDGLSGDPDQISLESRRLAERDRLDSSRTVAPLRQAEDARLLETTGLGFEEQVAQIVEWAHECGLSAP